MHYGCFGGCFVSLDIGRVFKVYYNNLVFIFMCQPNAHPFIGIQSNIAPSYIHRVNPYIGELEK